MENAPRRQGRLAIQISPDRLEQLAYDFAGNRARISAELDISQNTLSQKFAEIPGLREAFNRGCARAGVTGSRARRPASEAARLRPTVKSEPAPEPEPGGDLNAADERTVLAAVRDGFRHYADIRRATGLTSARMVAAVERCVSNFSLQRRDGADLRDEFYLEGEACPPVRQVGCSRW